MLHGHLCSLPVLSYPQAASERDAPGRTLVFRPFWSSHQLHCSNVLHLGFLLVVLADAVRRQPQELQLRGTIILDDDMLRAGSLCCLFMQGVTTAEGFVTFLEKFGLLRSAIRETFSHSEF